MDIYRKNCGAVEKKNIYIMPIFKTTSEIVDTPWQDPEVTLVPNTIVPETIEWHGIRDMGIDDVEIWEELYYQGGNIGIYAAHKPLAEFYMITYNLYIDTPLGIKTYYGPTARRALTDRAKELGVDLEQTTIWVDELNAWMYEEGQSTPTE